MYISTFLNEFDPTELGVILNHSEINSNNYNLDYIKLFDTKNLSTNFTSRTLTKLKNTSKNCYLTINIHKPLKSWYDYTRYQCTPRSLTIFNFLFFWSYHNQHKSDPFLHNKCVGILKIKISDYFKIAQSVPELNLRKFLKNL